MFSRENKLFERNFEPRNKIAGSFVHNFLLPLNISAYAIRELYSIVSASSSCNRKVLSAALTLLENNQKAQQLRANTLPLALYYLKSVIPRGL
jgi:hypothetical protein